MINYDFAPQRPYKYVRYGRMSTDAQNRRSPDQQFDVIDDTKVKLGYPWQHLRDYRDDGITGKYLKRRPDFSAMLADIRTGSVQPDLILLDTSERLGPHRGVSRSSPTASRSPRRVGPHGRQQVCRSNNAGWTRHGDV